MKSCFKLITKFRTNTKYVSFYLFTSIYCFMIANLFSAAQAKGGGRRLRENAGKAMNLSFNMEQ